MNNKATTTIPWDEERKQVCFDMWMKGKSATEIARYLTGVSRNAVIGMVHRRGLTRPAHVKPAQPMQPKLTAPRVARSHVKPPKPGPQNKVAVVFGKTEKTDKWKELRRIQGQAIINRVSFQTIESPNARPFMEATSGCKWPIGNGLSMLFCCNPKVIGSYCEGHAAIAYVAPKDNISTARAVRSFTRFDRVA